jgi:hypothetical protein
MLCSWCYGKGLADASTAGATSGVPYRECDGCGILHCCEGRTEQPLPPPPQDTGGRSKGGGDGQPDRPRL